MLSGVPIPSLVLLIGAAGSGKSTFAQRHFRPTEIVSSDACRALVCDDEANQDVTPDAFQIVRLIVRKRLKYRRLTVVDATNVTVPARARLLSIAFQFDVPAIAIVFQVAEDVCCERSAARVERTVSQEVIRDQILALERAVPELKNEGFSQVLFIQPDSSVLLS